MKSSKSVYIVLVLIIIGLVGFLFVQDQKSNDKTTIEAAKTTEVDNSNVETSFTENCSFAYVASWKEAVDQDGKYTFMYPPELDSNSFLKAGSDLWPPTMVIKKAASTNTARVLPCKNVLQALDSYKIDITKDGAAGTEYRTYKYNVEVAGLDIESTFTIGFSQCDAYDDALRTQCKLVQSKFDSDVLLEQMLGTLGKK